MSVLVEQKFIGGSQIGNPFLQLSNFASQLMVLILDLEQEKKFTQIGINVVLSLASTMWKACGGGAPSTSGGPSMSVRHL